MRNAYLNALYDLASKDERIVSFVADNGLIVYDDFRRDFPDRYYNFGISEENMVAAAAGVASCGFIPFVYTINAFIAYRAYEFLRDDVCFQNQNVKLVGIGSGLTYSTLGPSHHTTEDIALLRSLPNLTVYSPATRKETEYIMKMAYETDGPVYIRLGNNANEYDDCLEFQAGKPRSIRKGKDVVVFSTGPIIDEVMKAAKMLSENNIECEVMSFHTIKPVDFNVLKEILLQYQRVVVVEEHNVIGGIATIISECMAENSICAKFVKIGLQDSFAVDYGKIGDVRSANGLDSFSIYNNIKSLMMCKGDL